MGRIRLVFVSRSVGVSIKEGFAEDLRMGLTVC